jgi:3-keto-disaccharide hydrolase
MSQQKPGYDDTPLIPGQTYKVHDKERPHPRVVTSGTESSQAKPGQAPSDAIVLFDGKTLSGWATLDGGAAQWKVENGYMQVVPKTGNISSREQFGDCQLHVEWAAPAEVKGESQGRGNSGVFLMGLYEIQVLDCYDNPTYADGYTAAIYGEHPPLVNACRKPGEWQTYDIVWFGPRFDGDKLVCPARLTLFHNGILVHHNRELTGPTTHRQVLQYKPHPAVGPLVLQDHGDLVRFRNIWYRPLSDAE